MQNKRLFLLLLMGILMTLGLSSFSAAENLLFEEEVPEGLYLYAPTAGKYLPWNQTESGNVYEIIGLAPHDSTITLCVKNGEETIWQEQTMSEGNGYFCAVISAQQLDSADNYTLEAMCGSYAATVPFKAYGGTLSDFATDPLHLEILTDLTEEEMEEYTRNMEELAELEEAEEVQDDTEMLHSSREQMGPNEYRNSEFSYLLKPNNTATLIYYYGTKRHLVLPEIIDGYPVTEINFRGSKHPVLSETIPSTIIISYYDLNNFTYLTAIYVNPGHPQLASVNGILYSRDLRRLIGCPDRYPDKEVVVPEGTTLIESHAFNMPSLHKVKLPETLRTIQQSAFSSRNLREIHLPDSLRVLEKNSFGLCSIRRITIPNRTAVTGPVCNVCTELEEITVMPGNETVQSIDGVLFSADGETLIQYPPKKELQEYNVPSGTVEIGASAFLYAENLGKVVIPDGVVSIGRMAFCNTALRSVALPDTLTEIESGVFDDCTQLQEFIISPSHPTLDAIDNKYLYSKDHSIFYCYPGGIQETTYAVESETKIIDEDAFSHAHLTHVILPEGLLEIRPRAFTYTDIESLQLPEGLESIGGNAFFHLPKLKSIYIPGSVESIGTYPFSGCWNLTNVALGYGISKLGSLANMRKLTISIPETVNEIQPLTFLGAEDVQIITTEGSYAHEYALQNQLKVDVEQGHYETFTEQIKAENSGEISVPKTTRTQVIITGNGTINIREKPDAESRRIGRASSGEMYSWLETVEKGSSVWYKIQLNDGSQGYVSGKVSKLKD